MKFTTEEIGFFVPQYLKLFETQILTYKKKMFSVPTQVEGHCVIAKLLSGELTSATATVTSTSVNYFNHRVFSNLTSACLTYIHAEANTLAVINHSTFLRKAKVILLK